MNFSSFFWGRGTFFVAEFWGYQTGNMFCIIVGRLCMASTFRDSTPAGFFFGYRPEIDVSQEFVPLVLF